MKYRIIWKPDSTSNGYYIVQLKSFLFYETLTEWDYMNHYPSSYDIKFLYIEDAVSYAKKVIDNILYYKRKSKIVLEAGYP